jgi:hypothetical protein
MATPINGLLGGLIAGLVAAGAIRLIDSEPPVVALLLESALGARATGTR